MFIDIIILCILCCQLSERDFSKPSRLHHALLTLLHQPPESSIHLLENIFHQYRMLTVQQAVFTVESLISKVQQQKQLIHQLVQENEHLRHEIKQLRKENEQLKYRVQELEARTKKTAPIAICPHLLTVFTPILRISSSIISFGQYSG